MNMVFKIMEIPREPTSTSVLSLETAFRRYIFGFSVHPPTPPPLIFRLPVRPKMFLGIFLRTHRRNGLKVGMQMYPNS